MPGILNPSPWKCTIDRVTAIHEPSAAFYAASNLYGGVNVRGPHLSREPISNIFIRTTASASSFTRINGATGPYVFSVITCISWSRFASTWGAPDKRCLAYCWERTKYPPEAALLCELPLPPLYERKAASPLITGICPAHAYSSGGLVHLRPSLLSDNSGIREDVQFIPALG